MRLQSRRADPENSSTLFFVPVLWSKSHANCLSPFSLALIKYPEKSSLKKEGLSLLHSLRVWGKSLRQEFKEADQALSEPRRELLILLLS